MSDSPHAAWALRGGHSRAVFFVHGILGSPAQFRALGKLAHAAGWDCIAALLPGHGGAQSDFSSVRGAHWQEAVERELSEIRKSYAHVVVFAHSMGCLLALQAAADGIALDGMVLLSPALFPRLSVRQAHYALRTLFGGESQAGSVHAAYRDAFSVQRGPVIGYIRWALPLLSLTRLSHATRAVLQSVRCPVLVIQPRHDESVRNVGATRLARALPATKVIWLENSGHLYLSPDDAKKIGEETLSFLARIDPGTHPR